MGISLIKKAKDLCNENYKTFMNETEEDRKKWKDILCSCRGIGTVTMSILPKVTYRVSAILTKLSMAFFTEVEKFQNL